MGLGIKGKNSIFWILAIISLIALLFVINAFAEGGFSDKVTLDNTTNGTWTTNPNYMFNCTATTNNSALDTSGINLSLYFGPASAGAPAFNQSNQTGVANNTQFNFTVNNIAEGIYYWTCSASVINSSGNPSNVTFNGTNYTITFDRTTPQLVRLNSPTNFISPVNGLNTSLSEFEFNFSSVDNLAENITCNISMDGVTNNVSKTVLNGTTKSNIVNISGLANGSHSWNMTCYDPANATGNTTSTRSFTVDTAGPSDITLNSPRNNLNTSLTEIEFNFSATDNVDTNLSCNITVDGVVNVSTKSVLSGSTHSAATNITNFAQGNHFWNVTCYDEANNSNTSNLRLFTVDTTVPSLVRLNSPTNFISPVNGLNTSLSEFEFNISSVDNLAENITCNISMDGVRNNASKTVLNGTDKSNSVNISGLANGSHSWNVTCYDPANTTGNTTSTRSFTVDTAGPSDITLNSVDINTSSTTVLLNFSATDNVDTNLSCNITVDSVVNVSTKSVLSGSTNSAAVNVNNLAQGNHFWNVTCYDEANNSNTSNTRLFAIDSTPPVVTGISPNSISIPTNYTTLPIKFNVTIREAGNISSVFYILNTVVAAGTPSNPGLNDSNTVNSSNLMTFGAGSQFGTNYTYTANLTLNFSSLFTNPGAHSIWFCANDTANNLRCSDTALSYVIKGVNISELKYIFSGTGQYPFSMNITLENFTADEDGFMAPTVQNYTITFNLTANNFVNIVGMTINESYMRDVSNTQVNNSVTSNIRGAIGQDFDINMSFMNVTSFLPGGSLYKYGRFDFIGKNFEKVYRCNGTSADTPGTCIVISRCNYTVTEENQTAIPSGGACFAKNITNATGVDAGSTYIFSTTFSGGGGANDTTAPRMTFVSPTNASVLASNPININITFTDGSGINNNTINITINGTMYSNRQNTSLITCTPNTNASINISCNISLTLPETDGGFINITAQANDSSINGNQNTTSIVFQVDTAKPSVFGITPNLSTITYGQYHNFTILPVTLVAHVNETGNLSSVFYILNSVASGTGLNDSDVINTSSFMTLSSSLGQTYVYTANLTLNYTSSFTNPGAHRVYFCANDTGNNINCTSQALVFVIQGANISELERLMPAYYSTSLNITYENDTSAIDNSMISPWLYNYTFVFNRTPNKFVSIVGTSINESHLRGIGNAQVNESITSGMLTSIGSDFNNTLNSTFMNMSSFLSQGTLYRYGLIEFNGGSWQKISYCTGSIDSPTCVRIRSCNGTNISISNYSSIPSGSACYVTNRTNKTGVNSGRTYIYSDTFSGAAVGNDTIGPSFSFVNLTNATILTEMPINFNITISDGEGINNNTINITINETIYSNLLGHGVNITCTPNTNASTTINCNISLILNDTRSAFINITVLARDVNDNLNSSTLMFYVNTTPRVALVAPAEGYFFSSGLITFNYTPSDNGLLRCMLWGNLSSASFTGNQTNSSAIVTNTLTNFSVLNLREGSYIWNVKCNDTVGNNAFNTTNRTFTVDLTNPSASISASPTTINRAETVTIGCSGSDNIDTVVNTSIRVLLPTGDYSSDTDGTFTDTSTSGTYTAYCTTTDDALRTATVSTLFFVNTPSGSGGGSSGGGGGGASGSTLSTSTSVYSLVKANVPMESKLSNTESTGVEAIVFTAKEELFNVKIGISQLNSLPSAITNLPAGEVFKYVLVSTTNLPDDKIANATLKFHVDKSWLSENGLSAEDVILKRYNSNVWSDLKTEILNEDSARVYYAATTPGMSYFVIASKLSASGTPTVTEETIDETKTEETQPSVIPPSEVVVAQKSSRTWLWVLLGILLVGIVVAVVLFIGKNKKRRY